MNNPILQNDPVNYKRRIVLFLIFFGGLGGMLYGYDIGVIAGALLFINKEIPLTDLQTSLVVGAVLGGGSVSILVSGILADIFGRKKMIIASGIIFIIGTLLVVTANGFISLLLGRLIQGVTVGIITIVMPLFLTEIAPAKIRGRCLAIFQLFLNGGILLSFFIDMLFIPSGNWRGMLVCVIVPGALLLAGSFFIPESPSWLYAKNRIKDAAGVLNRIFYEEGARKALSQMHESQLNQAKLKEESGRINIFQRAYIIPFFIALAVACFNQLTGVNSILQYSPLLFKSAGVKSDFLSMLFSTGVGALGFVSILVSSTLIDKLGRKLLLCIGTGGVTLALLFMGISQIVISDGFIKVVTFTAGILVFKAFFAFGPAVVIWLALSETLPIKIRSKGMAICLFLNSIVSAILASLFLYIANLIGFSGLFIFCGICTALYFLIATFILPETKGKTLEEIETYFQKK